MKIFNCWPTNPLIAGINLFSITQNMYFIFFNFFHLLHFPLIFCSIDQATQSLFKCYTLFHFRHIFPLPIFTKSTFSKFLFKSPLKSPLLHRFNQILSTLAIHFINLDWFFHLNFILCNASRSKKGKLIFFKENCNFFN